MAAPGEAPIILINGVAPGGPAEELVERFGPSLERYGLVFPIGLHATTLEDTRTVDCLTGTELQVDGRCFRAGEPIPDLPRLDDDLLQLAPTVRIRVLLDKQGRCVRFQYPASKFTDRMSISGVTLGLKAQLVEIPLGQPTRTRAFGDGRLQVHGPVTVGIRDERVCMIHATHLLVGCCLFVRYEPLASLESLLQCRGPVSTKSPHSVKHLYRNKARHEVQVGESERYAGQCLSFTLGSPP